MLVYKDRTTVTREARRAVDYAQANGLMGFRANWEKLSSSIYNMDPPMRLVVTRMNNWRKSTQGLAELAMRSTNPIAEGLLFTPPMAREAQDPRGFLVVVAMTDYLEGVARARRLVFDD